MFRRYSIRLKVAVFVALLVSTIAVSLASYVLWQQNREQMTELRGDSVTTTNLFQTMLISPLRMGDEYAVFDLLRAPFTASQQTKGTGGRSLRHILLLDDAGHILSSSDPLHFPLQQMLAQQEPQFAGVIANLADLKLGDSPLFYGQISVDNLYVISPVGENGMKYGNLMLDYSVEPVREIFVKQSEQAVVAIVLITGLLMVIAQLLVRRFTQPLLALNRDMRAVADRHRLSMGESTNVADELRLLRSSFRELDRALNLAEQERELYSRREKLAFAGLEHSTQGIFITDVKGNIEYVNSAFERISGYPRGAAIGKNPRFLRSDKTPAATYQMLWAALTKEQAWHRTHQPSIRWQ